MPSLALAENFYFNHPDNRRGKRTGLFGLDPTSKVYSKLERQFRKNWQHTTKPQPNVLGIIKILSSEKSLQSYEQYRFRVQAACSKKGQPVNEQLLFHGTHRGCLLMEDPTRIKPCSSERCSLCGILRKSFDVSKCGIRHRFRRFGMGIYTTSCSSKADSYVTNNVKSSTVRVMLVNRVVVGEPLKLQRDVPDLHEPPWGFHSVVGVPGRNLNYEETVVYENDAIRPAYLIVYEADPPFRWRAEPTPQRKPVLNQPAVKSNQPFPLIDDDYVFV